MIIHTQALQANWPIGNKVEGELEAPISTRWQAVDSLSLMWLSRK